MNQVITIPKQLAKKGELVILPRLDYEEILRVLKEQSRLIKKKAFSVELVGALKEYSERQYHGPFKTAEEGIAFLKRRAKR